MIEAEDVVQDTFAAFVALDELQEDPPLRARLFRIAHNRALDLLCRDRQAARLGLLGKRQALPLEPRRRAPSTPIRGVVAQVVARRISKPRPNCRRRRGV
jgi:DNA-directed RNA polymerase specialized sigma24 family protein